MGVAAAADDLFLCRSGGGLGWEGSAGLKPKHPRRTATNDGGPLCLLTSQGLSIAIAALALRLRSLAGACASRAS